MISFTSRSTLDPGKGLLRRTGISMESILQKNPSTAAERNKAFGSEREKLQSSDRSRIGLKNFFRGDQGIGAGL